MPRYRILFSSLLIFQIVLYANLLAQDPTSVRFQSAKPIWPEGMDTEMNLLVGFRAVFEAIPQIPTVLKVTGSSLYRISVNGKFCGLGPARGPHQFFRVDEWDLSGRLKPGRNLVAIEVAGYNVNSYYLLDQPSFLQAEVVAGQKVLASTAGLGASFQAIVLPERVRKVQRYSFQRPFSEYYRLTPGHDAWRKNLDSDFTPAKCAVFAERKLLPRGVSYPDFTLRQPQSRLVQGEFAPSTKAQNVWKDRALTAIGPELKGFREEDLEVVPSLELQHLETRTSKPIGLRYSWNEPLQLEKGAFEILDLGVNLTGFIGANVICRQKSRLVITFDEVLSDGDLDFKRLSTVNILGYQLEPGNYAIESLEPYTMRYLKAMVLEGGCELKGIYLREYANPDVWRAQFASSDERLNRLFAAGRETFRQNAVDLFMDCPSRERAGWLCDSFFTSRTAQLLSGDERVERNFFENYLLPPKFDHQPDGMVPMCYPADHYDGNFIPNWALWFVLQLEEYYSRSGDRQLVEALRPRVLRIFDYFRPFQNQDGLLEKLKGWVFVEWSAANDYVQDINYPTNMLYAAALSAAGQLYGLPRLVEEASRIRESIRLQSFNGRFFVDNAIRVDGKLRPTANCTEVCQYFAFHFEVASPETHPMLWRLLRDEFGPNRLKTHAYPEVKLANAFVGNVLRLEILSRYGLNQQLLDESVDYLLYMAERTGTLWENNTSVASCNHGFASHVIKNLYRDVLGLNSLDCLHREVKICLPDLRLDWCEGRVPGPDGPFAIQWHKRGDEVLCHTEIPAGYRISIENRSRLRLVCDP